MPYYILLAAQAAYQAQLAQAAAQRRHLQAQLPARSLRPACRCSYCGSHQPPDFRCRHCGAPLP